MKLVAMSRVDPFGSLRRGRQADDQYQQRRDLLRGGASVPRKPSCDGVLVIDDDANIRSVLVGALEEQGYRTISAANGAEALEVLRILPTPPSVILLDLTMPVMDGWQFCAEQRQDPLLSKIPVVVVSADGNIEEEASQVAASGYLRKPFLIQELLHTIAKVCEPV